MVLRGNPITIVQSRYKFRLTTSLRRSDATRPWAARGGSGHRIIRLCSKLDRLVAFYALQVFSETPTSRAPISYSYLAVCTIHRCQCAIDKSLVATRSDGINAYPGRGATTLEASGTFSCNQETRLPAMFVRSLYSKQEILKTNPLTRIATYLIISFKQQQG